VKWKQAARGWLSECWQAHGYPCSPLVSPSVQFAVGHEAGDGRVPLLVIDGREITWEEFGRMLMTFEGWQFKLEIRDMSEEL
jgi:hypothetical protein